MIDYSNLIAVHDGIAERIPVAPEVYGFDNATLSDLTFLSEQSFPVLRLWAWWPAEYIDEPLGINKKYADETLTPIPERKVVTVYRTQVDMTPEEIEARDSAIKSQRKLTIESKRYSFEPIEVASLGEVFVLDTRNKYLVTDMRGEAAVNPQYTSVIKSKAGNWVNLDVQSINELASAIRARYDALYARQKELDDAVDNWTYTEDMLQVGWPLPLATQD